MCLRLKMAESQLPIPQAIGEVQWYQCLVVGNCCISNWPQMEFTKLEKDEKEQLGPPSHLAMILSRSFHRS